MRRQAVRMAVHPENPLYFFRNFVQQHQNGEAQCFQAVWGSFSEIGRRGRKRQLRPGNQSVDCDPNKAALAEFFAQPRMKIRSAELQLCYTPGQLNIQPPT